MKLSTTRFSFLHSREMTRIATVVLLLGLMISLADARFWQKESGDGKKDSLVGDWDLFVTVQGGENQKGEEPKTVSFQETDAKLSGKVAVPNVTPAATGFQTQGARDLTLTELKYDGKILSFNVGDEDNTMIAELIRTGENEFAGTWRSPISGRWKGTKSEFRGTLKIVRKK